MLEYRPSMQYTATGFTNPFTFIFGAVYQSARDVEVDYQRASFFIRSVRYAHRFVEAIEVYVYAPVSVACAPSRISPSFYCAHAADPPPASR